MIAPNFVEFIREQVAGRIGVKAIGDRIAVDIPLAFPDGDECRVFVSRSDDGKWIATDGGSTIMRASYSGAVNVLGRGYAARFRQLLNLYGLSEDKGLLKTSDEREIGDAVFTIAQACMDVVHLANTPKEKKPRVESNFEKKLSRIVADAAKAGRIHRYWHDAEHDPNARYPVTYRVDSNGPSQKSLLIFGANSKLNCMHSTMASLFLNPWRKDCNSVAVYNSKSDTFKAEAQRLNEQMDKVFPSIEDDTTLKDYIAESVT